MRTNRNMKVTTVTVITNNITKQGRKTSLKQTINKTKIPKGKIVCLKQPLQFFFEEMAVMMMNKFTTGQRDSNTLTHHTETQALTCVAVWGSAETWTLNLSKTEANKKHKVAVQADRSQKETDKKGSCKHTKRLRTKNSVSTPILTAVFKVRKT